MQLKLMQKGVLAKPYGIHLLLGGLYVNTKRAFWLPCIIYSTLVVGDIIFGIISVAYTVVEIWTDNVALSLKQFNYVLLRLLTLGLVMTGLLRTQNMDELFPMLVRHQYTTPLNPEQQAVIAKYDKQFWKVFNYFKYLMYIVNTVWIAVLPVVEITLNEVIRYDSTQNTTHKFGQYIPVLAWHPYDPDIFISFLIQYILQVFFTFLLCHTAVGITASYIDVAIFLISSFKVLKISLQDIEQRALYLYCVSTNRTNLSMQSLEGESVSEDPIYHRHLLQCLEEDLNHQLLLRKIQRGMLDIYGPIMLFLLLIGGVFLCTKAITLLEVNKLNDAHQFRNLFRMVQSVLSFTSYIFVFCWYGEEITQASAEVLDALYFCPWFDTPIKLKKAIYTMMICSLKASQMSVAGLKTLNLKSFGEVVSAAYSYFNIVRSMK